MVCMVSRPKCLLQDLTTMSLINKILYSTLRFIKLRTNLYKYSFDNRGVAIKKLVNFRFNGHQTWKWILQIESIILFIVLATFFFPSQKQTLLMYICDTFTNSLNFVIYFLQRVPTLCAFWDMEKTVLHEIRVSGTVLCVVPY